MKSCTCNESGERGECGDGDDDDGDGCDDGNDDESSFSFCSPTLPCTSTLKPAPGRVMVGVVVLGEFRSTGLVAACSMNSCLR